MQKADIVLFLTSSILTTLIFWFLRTLRWSVLLKNESLLNKDKVVVTGFDNKENQKDFKNLLVKYGISKFRVNTK